MRGNSLIQIAYGSVMQERCEKTVAIPFSDNIVTSPPPIRIPYFFAKVQLYFPTLTKGILVPLFRPNQKDPIHILIHTSSIESITNFLRATSFILGALWFMNFVIEVKSFSFIQTRHKCFQVIYMYSQCR